METSLLIARLIGPVAAVVGLCVLLNYPFIRDVLRTIAEHRGLVFLAGLASLSLGVVLVNVHNVWGADWRLLITLFGWLAVLSGLVRLLLPGIAIAAAERMSSRLVLGLAGGGYLLFGLALSAFGYLA